ncbi:MAG: hypothetical protein II716_09415 [Treponema sp.]|nr:hypothetical protein [Treponema sp.]MBQ5385264.1 hypothetical protein [Treponema sp.]
MDNFISGLDGLLRHVSIVFNILKRSCFRPYRTKEFDRSIKILKSYLDTDDSETVVFCCIFYVFFKGGENPVSYYDLASPEFMNCNPLYLLRYKEDLTGLAEKKLIKKLESESGEPFYVIPEYVSAAIVSNMPKIIFPQFDDDDDNELLIPVKKILERTVYFSDEIEEKIRKYSDLLKHDSFAAKQDELKKKRLPPGISFVFSGVRKTAKKQAAFTIAKKSDRSVFSFNLKNAASQLMNNPDSLKALFSTYKRFSDKEKLEGRHKPVFVLEGASIFLQKRFAKPDSEFETVIQIVQEIFEEIMESFSGILIAICDEYDDAFDNNFYGKIYFPEPTDESKVKIWQNKIEWLDEKTVSSFSDKFSLSSEEISNIAKRIQIDEVLEGKRPSASAIEEYCRNERKHMQKYSGGFLAK